MSLSDCVRSLVYFARVFCPFSHTLYSDFNPFFQICMHPRRVHSDHRVHLADRHSGGDSEKVLQPHLLHPLLPKPLHYLALGGHGRGLPGHSAVHRGVEQRAGGPAWTRRQGKEGGVRKTKKGLVVEEKNNHFVGLRGCFLVNYPEANLYCYVILFSS